MLTSPSKFLRVSFTASSFTASLRALLPPENSSDLPLRNMHKFQVPQFKTNRFNSVATVLGALDDRDWYNSIRRSRRGRSAQELALTRACKRLDLMLDM